MNLNESPLLKMNQYWKRNFFRRTFTIFLLTCDMFDGSKIMGKSHPKAFFNEGC